MMIQNNDTSILYKDVKLAATVIKDITRLDDTKNKPSLLNNNCLDCKYCFTKENKTYCKERPKGPREFTKDENNERQSKHIDFEEVNSNMICSVFEEENYKEHLLECYRNIITILKKYCDIKEEYYSVVAIWVLGTYLHDEFVTYPYLFFNAMKGSGKSRLLKLISHLSHNGDVLTSLTEAVLFRTNGMLGIDEFEGLNKQGNDNLRELLNASYKKGNKVKRLKKQKTLGGEEHVIEEFDVYRPIAMANIWGMENVLGDRCITLILERSNNKNITNLIEAFDYDHFIKTTLTTLNNTLQKNNTPKNEISKGRCSLCSVVTPLEVYLEWNSYLGENYTNDTSYINSNYNTNYTNNNNNNNINDKKRFFDKIYNANIDGRHLELTFPLFIIAQELGQDILDKLIDTIKNIIKDKKEEDYLENYDVSLIDFVSQELETDNYTSIQEIVRKFKEFTHCNDESINNKWLGRALKRLNLIKEKRRLHRGVEVRLNIQKAQKKILMFKHKED